MVHQDHERPSKMFRHGVLALIHMRFFSNGERPVECWVYSTDGVGCGASYLHFFPRTLGLPLFECMDRPLFPSALRAPCSKWQEASSLPAAQGCRDHAKKWGASSDLEPGAER